MCSVKPTQLSAMCSLQRLFYLEDASHLSRHGKNAGAVLN
jgi:hypothetical protein